jgi:hypothetical protein
MPMCVGLRKEQPVPTAWTQSSSGRCIEDTNICLCRELNSDHIFVQLVAYFKNLHGHSSTRLTQIIWGGGNLSILPLVSLLMLQGVEGRSPVSMFSVENRTFLGYI